MSRMPLDIPAALPASTSPRQGWLAAVVCSMERSRRLQDTIAAVVFAALPFIVYWSLWGTTHRQTLGMDYPDFQPGQQLLFLQHLRDGYYPLWAPGDSGGVPFAAYFLTQQYSPLTWLLASLDATYKGLQLELLTLQRLVLLGMSGFFVYLTVRRLNLGALAGIVAGAVFIFNFRMLDGFRYGSGLDTAVWLPVLIFLADCMVERPGLRLLLLYAFAQHMLVITGHTQNAFYAICFVNAWFILRLWLLRPCRRWLAARAGCMAGAQALGLGLSAAMLIPVIAEMVPLWTNRTHGGAAYYYEVHLTWTDLLCNVFFPWLADVHSGFYWSQFGWVMLTAAVAMFVFHRAHLAAHNRRLLVFLLAVLAFCLLYSLGPLTPVAPMVNAIVPGLKTFRGPGRVMVVGTYAAAILAAMAVERLLTDPSFWKTFRRVGLVLGLAYLAAGAALLAAWAGGAVHWGEVVNYARQLHLLLLGDITENSPACIQSQPRMIPFMAVVILAVAGISIAATWLCHARRLSRAGLVIAIGLAALVETSLYHRQGTYTIPGRCYTPRSAKFREVDVYHTRIFPRQTLFAYSKKNLVKSNHEPGRFRLRLDLPGPICEFLTAGGRPAWRIYYQNVRGHEIPRAYVTPHVQLVAGDHLTAVSQLNPYQASVLDVSDPANAGVAADATLASLARVTTDNEQVDWRSRFERLNAGVRIEQYTPNKAVFVVQTTDGGLFNYNDTYLKGWHAVLDGREVPIYRVNHLFKGVVLPPGRHRIAFTYDPPSFRVALPIALAAACAWLTLVGMSFVPGRKWKCSAALAVLILAAAIPSAVHLYHRAYDMAYRDGLINYDPTAPRPYAPDYDEYLWNVQRNPET